ncbi:MAG: AAA domain-containing protein [Methylococcaceae bacterium]
MKENDILKDHRQHFIKRLITRNPLLKCTKNSYREDLTELVKIGLEIDKDPKKTLPLDILQNLLSATPKKIEIANAHKKNLAKCKKIKIETDDYFHTTGQLSFYLGYPFVTIPLESNRYYLAPLFLWAVSCKVTATSIVFERVKDEEGIVLDPQLNRILQVWLAHEKNIHLTWDNAEELIWDNISTETKSALSNWVKCDSNLDNTQVSSIPNKEELQTLIKAKVISSAIVGYIPIKGQALLDDLDKLIALFSSNSNNNGVLDYFLSPRQLKTEPPASNPAEKDKWLVTDADHSQESVLWNTRKFDLMVLQGSPGTGKSQVIVNLIADALANQKKVLVVCQKKAALDVLKKRLTANGLGDLLQLIDDAQKDRMRIIKSIRDLESNTLAKKQFSQIDIERQTTSEILKDCENFLDKSNQFLTDHQQGRRLTYGNLKAKLHKLNKQDINVYGQLQSLYQQCLQNTFLPDNLQELKELSEEVGLFVDNYQACNYSNNPWKNIQNSPNNIGEINILLNRLVSLSQSLENKSTYFYSSNITWLAEHSWVDAYYPVFLSQECQQVNKGFKQLSIDTQKLKNWLSIHYVDTILTSVRAGEVITYYQQLQKFSGYIQQVLYIKDKLKQIEIFNVFLKNSANQYSSWIDIVECFSLQAWFDNLTSKNTFSKFSFEEQKSKLSKVVDQKRNKDIEHILARFDKRMSSRNMLENRGLLRLRKSTKFNVPKTSLRRLYTSGFEELHQIYPVLLTNPETVSSILDLKANLYDLVIIDEASQMFMADALPLLYRSKSAFISGDIKQMPPSDFFMSLGNDTNIDEDQEDEDDELNANINRLIPADGEYCLLEAAEYSVQKGNPNHAMLSVHYRSEFKELIDFSNHAFYDGKLIAASSNKKLPGIIKAPIELNTVENAQAKAGVNDVEALAVVTRIKAIWQQQDSLSLGVITLNVKQKDIIDDLLFEEAQLDNEFANRLEQERNKTKDGEDIGFFVRSVEHVQGDERDIIILSTVYDGVRKDFGAITKKEKGRKRLNVAITRAKLGMIIYSSLSIDGISNDNQRDESENYWFWKYMCYARAISSSDKKAAELVLISLNPTFKSLVADAEPDSYFEEDVAEFLREHNYHVGYQIGESGFRIDLGVKRHLDDRLYLCGIECDGRQYHSSWTARLNDIWRQKILENKGWRIVRIWSDDWFDNREATQKKLLATLAINYPSRLFNE